MQKLYCYVDESGQATQGNTFVVTVVIAQTERDDLILILDQIEGQSGKGSKKWTNAKDTARVDCCLTEPGFMIDTFAADD
jgi:hypothetical protein